MTTDLYKRVYFSDGEGLTYGDLNDIQSFIRSQLWDGFYQKTAPGLVSATGSVLATAGTDFGLGGTNPADINNTHAYALKGGQAFPRRGSAGNKVKITPGTLFQKVGTGDGITPTFLPFTFTGAEEVTLAVGDASLPRIDIIQMKLELITEDSQTRDFKDGTTGVITSTTFNKKLRVQCTLSLKQGTANATPTFPTVDAGYVPICAIYAFAGWGTTYDWLTTYAVNSYEGNGYIMDLRMPMRVRAFLIGADRILCGANTARHAGGAYVQTSNATNDFHAVLPEYIDGGRIVGVSYTGSTITAGRVYLATDSCQSAWAYSTFGTYMNHLGFLAGATHVMFDYKQFQAEQRGGVYTKEMNANAAGQGPPMWGSGHRAVQQFESDNKNASRPDVCGVHFKDVDNGALITNIIVYVAE
jgi:hypothetical protein